MELVEKRGFVGKKKETEVNILEGGYKGKTKSYQNYQTPTSQVTSINFAKTSILN